MAASSSSPKTRPLGFDPLKIRLHTESLKRLPSLSVDEPTEIAQWLVAFEGVFSKIEWDYITTATPPWSLTQRQWIDKLNAHQTSVYSSYSRPEQSEAFNEFKEWAETLSHRTCGVLLGHIAWQSEPELERQVLKGDSSHDAIKTSRNGWRLLQLLTKLGRSDTVQAQTAHEIEWAKVFNTANTPLDEPRTHVIFNDVSSFQAVNTKLHSLLRNYEDTDVNRVQQAHVFIKTILQLFEREVPMLASWAGTSLINLITDPTALGERDEFVASMKTIVSNKLPSSNASHLPAAREGILAWLHSHFV